MITCAKKAEHAKCCFTRFSSREQSFRVVNFQLLATQLKAAMTPFDKNLKSEAGR